MESNYLRNTVRGIAVGGGRDNRIDHNIIQGGLAAIQIDARGTTWYKSHVEGENSRIQQLCRRTLADSPVYAERYPELATMLSDEPHQPKGNEIRFNTFDCGIGIDLQAVNRNYLALEKNEKKSPAEFGTPDRILAQLGIRVLDRTLDKIYPEAKLVNETREAAQEVN